MTNDGTNTTTTTPTISPPSLSNETLRERILTGGGTGAARGSLTKVGSKYTNFLNSLLTSESDDNIDEGNTSSSAAATAAAAAALETELSLHDIEIRKLLLSSKASDYNSSQYTTTLNNMQHTLSSIQSDIQSLTTKLVTERQIKHNRQEYNALAKMANDKLPPIRETQIELSNVQNEIVSVQKEVKQASYELQVREKQMRVFMTSLNDLKSTLHEEELKKKEDNNNIMGNYNNVSEGANDGNKGGGIREVKGTKRKRSDGDDGGGSMTDTSNNDIGAL